MSKFITFANGSHLFGAFKHLDIQVNDYQALFRFLFDETARRWISTIVPPGQAYAQHVRVYWYVVDLMDEWDLDNPRTRMHLQERFHDDRELRRHWMEEVSRTRPISDQVNLEQAAFSACFDECKAWYEKKQMVLAGMNRFYHAVESSSDFLEICRSGRWRVDLLHKTITEKGLDVTMAVDMVSLETHFDVAIIVTGEVESLASIDVLKNRGKQVAIVDFLHGMPSEGRAKIAATPLRLSGDFVVPMYEADLLRCDFVNRGNAESHLHLREEP